MSSEGLRSNSFAAERKLRNPLAFSQPTFIIELFFYKVNKNSTRIHFKKRKTAELAINKINAYLKDR
jgi:hypothetical protein